MMKTTKMQKLFSVVLAAILLFTIIPFNAIEVKADNVSCLIFKLNPDGESYYIDYYRTSVTGELVIPSEYNGKPVTKIGRYAFAGWTKPFEVTIPSSVTCIDSHAFSQAFGLHSVAFEGESIPEIGEKVFERCTGLKSFSFPEGFTDIGYGMFYECTSLERIIIPDSVTTIGDSSFFGCSSLSDITISDGVTYIGDSAFGKCSALTNVTFGKNITEIAQGAFSDCISLTSFVFPNTVTAINDALFADCTSLTDITIPTNVTYIGAWAFHGCTEFKHIWYKGTKSQKEQIDIDEWGPPYSTATWHFESCNGTARHTYDNDCDSKCNVCEDPRIAPHVYDNDCDSSCNDCAFHREITHSFIAATCTTPKTCNICGTVEGKANGHFYTDTVTLPTCEEDGYTTYTCTVCGDAYIGDETGALGHSYTYTVTTAPTKTTDGQLIGECGNCESEQTVTLPILNETDYTYCLVEEPTCTLPGKVRYTWNNTKYGVFSFISHLPAEGHVYDTVVVTPPSCESSGYTTYTCDICDDSYVDDETSATGHTTIVDPAVEPTCIDSGLTEGSHCSLCGIVLVAQEIREPLGDAGHEYVGVICNNCGDLHLEAPVVTASNTASSGKIKLTWDAVEGAESYKIYRATSKNSTYSLMKTTTSTSYTNTSAKAGTLYYYYVVAINEDYDLTAKSAVVSRTCDLPYTTVTATNVSSSGKIKLTWDEVGSAVKYEIYRTTSKDESCSLITLNSTSYTDTSAEPGITYYYKVRAIAEISAANSAYSPIVSRTCDLRRVADVKASTDAATGKVELSWSGIFGAAKYEIRRATNENGTYSVIGITENNAYTDTTAKAGKKYYYKVKAIASNSAANGAYSSVVSCTCDLPAPVLTTENVASSGKIKVSWDEIDGAAKYEIYRATSKTGTYSLLKTTTSESYTDTTAKAGKSYYYKVKAIASSSSANSAYSSAKSRTCDLAQAKLTVSGVESSGKPKLTWDKVTDAKEYKVYRSTSKGGTYTCIKTTTSTSYTDSSAVAGTKYYYKVRAISSNTSAHGAYSSSLARTCDLARPTASIKLSRGKPKVSWDAVEGAVEYKVYRATSKSGTYSLVKTTTSKSYTDSSAKKGTTYYYKVVAVAKSSAANSAYSSVVSIKATK